MLTLYFDGSAKKPRHAPGGPLRIAWLAVDDRGETVAQHVRALGRIGTPHEAEWLALAAALDHLAAEGVRGDVTVVGDSPHVIKVLRGEWFSGKMRDPLREQAQQKIKQLAAAGCRISLQHVPRAENRADALFKTLSK